jgi:hypothetical protein
METFHMRIRVWCPVGNWDALYANGRFEPKFEVATIRFDFAVAARKQTAIPAPTAIP